MRYTQDNQQQFDQMPLNGYFTSQNVDYSNTTVLDHAGAAILSSGHRRQKSDPMHSTLEQASQQQLSKQKEYQEDSI